MNAVTTVRPLAKRLARSALATLGPLFLLALAVLPAPTGESPLVTSEDRKWLTGAALHSDLRSLLPEARDRILVVMFLMSSSGVADHPVHRLIEDLAAARERGVDVLVILDETFLEKNSTAWRQLSEAGIDVRWDSADRITHTKLVVVDDYAWVGSANWTASALTGGNLESTIRVRNRALSDRLYDIHRNYQTMTESQARSVATDALMAEARNTLAGPEGGMLRRNLAASGLDVDALMAGGVGAPVGEAAEFRTRTRARLGVGTGWARWGYPPLSANLLLLPTRSRQVLAVSAENWTVLQGDAEDLSPTPALDPLRTRIHAVTSSL